MQSVDDTPGTKAKLRCLQSTLAPAGSDEPVRRVETHGVVSHVPEAKLPAPGRTLD